MEDLENKSNNLPCVWNKPTKMRLKNAETVQTSRGAEFPVSHAVIAYRFIKKIMASGKDFVASEYPKTFHLGQFKIDKINKITLVGPFF